MILRMRSVGRRSMSTERGLRLSVIISLTVCCRNIFQDLLEMWHALVFYFEAMKEVDVQIRRARGVDDYQRIVELEKQVWGYTDPADFAAVPILMIANRFGGAVLVGEDRSQRLIGFSMANLGSTPERKLFWWSHMTAVAPEYQNRGLGLQLKL